MSDFLTVRDAAVAVAIVWHTAPTYALAAQGQVRAAFPRLHAVLDALTAAGAAAPHGALVARQWRADALTDPGRPLAWWDDHRSLETAWPALVDRLDDLARAVTARDGDDHTREGGTPAP